jgi:predicted ABC-type ATPase
MRPVGVEAAKVIVLAGPNGAGKTTAAPALLRNEIGLSSFVNADVIAQGLAGFSPESVASEAARIMLARLDELHAAGETFAFESTLSGRGHLTRLRRLAESGYEVQLFFLWLPSPELAIARVETRARHGGHHILRNVIRRRYERGLRNFVRLYRPLATAWRVYDGSGPHLDRDPVPLVARGERERVLEVRDEATWDRIVRRLDTLELRETPEVSCHPGEPSPELPARGDALDRAMTRGFHDAVRIHRAYGVPLVMWIDEEVRYVDPWSVPLPDDGRSDRDSAAAADPWHP